MTDQPPPDLSHWDLYNQIKAEIERTEARFTSVNERLDGLTERLDSGRDRFSRIEALLERAAQERQEAAAELRKLTGRLVAIETARAIQDGVESGVSDKISTWRRWVGRSLLFVFGNGAGMLILIWWLERQPPH